MPPAAHDADISADDESHERIAADARAALTEMARLPGGQLEDI